MCPSGHTRQVFGKSHLRKRFETYRELTASTADGAPARVSGIVRKAERVLAAPRSGTACVAYSVRVREPVGPESAQNSSEPYVDLVPFVVECALGRIAIESQFGELAITGAEVANVNDDTWTAFVDARRLSPIATGTEAMVCVGDRVTVAGTTMKRPTQPGRESGFRDELTEVCLVGDFDHPLLIARDET